MAEQKLAQLDLPLEPHPQENETINGQPIPRGTLAEFALAVYGKPLAEIKPWPQLPGGLNLANEKYATTAGKFYRLIWRGRGEKWLAAEDAQPYRFRVQVIAAGYELAVRTGAFFDEGW